MRRRTFFKYILGCFAIPFLGGGKAKANVIPESCIPTFPKDDKLYVVIQGHYNGKVWASHVMFDKTIMTFNDVDRICNDMGASLARCLSKNKVIKPYRDYS